MQDFGHCALRRGTVSSQDAAWTLSIMIGCLIIIACALPKAVRAQDVATSLDELLQTGELLPGDGVYITDTTGQRIRGRVTGLFSTRLAIEDDKWVTWTLAERDILRIERQDSLLSGILIGSAISAAGWYGLCYLEHGSSGGDPCYGTVHYFLPALATGAFLGAMVDADREPRILYEAGPSRKWTVLMLPGAYVGLGGTIAW